MANELIDLIKARRSVRSYKADPVPQELLDTVLEAGTYAPTGGGHQSPVIVAVTSPETRERLRALNAAVMGKETDPYYGAPAIVVVLADGGRGTFVEDGSCDLRQRGGQGAPQGVGPARGAARCGRHRARLRRRPRARRRPAQGGLRGARVAQTIHTFRKGALCRQHRCSQQSVPCPPASLKTSPHAAHAVEHLHGSSWFTISLWSRVSSAICAMSSAVSSKSHTSMFCSMRSRCTDLGITTTPRWMFHRRAT